MQDLWRLSATDLAALIRSKKVSAKEAATAALARLDAVNPKINAVVDHRPEDVLAQAAAIDAAIARGEDAGPLAGVPVTVKVNIDQQGFATTNGLKLQRDVIAHDQQSGDRQSAQGGRRHSRPHQLPGVFLSLVHHQPDPWRHQKSARSRHHAGRLVRRRGRGGRGRHRPYRARHRHRGLDPLSRLCLRRSRPAADASAASRPSMRRCRSAPSGRRSRAVSGPLARTIGDLRIALAAMSGRDVRDPWWVPAPLRRAGDAEARRAVSSIRMVLRPLPEVKAAVADAGKRLERAGWVVEEIENTPPLREAADLQTKLWLGDGYEAQLDAAEREGDPGALACLRGNQSQGVSVRCGRVLEGADAAGDADARMAAVLRDLCGAADAGVRRTAVSRSASTGATRPPSRGSGARSCRRLPFPSWGCPG